MEFSYSDENRLSFASWNYPCGNHRMAIFVQSGNPIISRELGGGNEAEMGIRV
jgi:hypothetical protein